MGGIQNETTWNHYRDEENMRKSKTFLLDELMLRIKTLIASAWRYLFNVFSETYEMKSINWIGNEKMWLENTIENLH